MPSFSTSAVTCTGRVFLFLSVNVCIIWYGYIDQQATQYCISRSAGTVGSVITQLCCRWHVHSACQQPVTCRASCCVGGSVVHPTGSSVGGSRCCCCHAAVIGPYALSPVLSCSPSCWFAPYRPNWDLARVCVDLLSGCLRALPSGWSCPGGFTSVSAQVISGLTSTARILTSILVCSCKLLPAYRWITLDRSGAQTNKTGLFGYTEARGILLPMVHWPTMVS